MLKYVFAAIFIALAWALVLVFRDFVPMWPAVVATVVIGGGLLAYVVFKLLAGKRAAAAIERGLRDQAARGGEGMRPDLAAEIQAMEAEFNKAVNALKSSKLGRSGRDALGLLPWYVIIGPPGSGKTTAIRSSGLKFPYGGKSGAVRGVGGTRNCDWWMTNEAILLDTAGRWTTEDDDRDEWLAFLDLLKRTRPKKPINGILLAVSTSELLGNEDQIGDLARSLRERIDEVIARLDMVVPVYLMVTKCDLLSGFIETFGDLKDRDRGQVWGFTLPLVNEHADHVEAFAQHFDDLGDVLERNAVYRMGEERRIDAREQIRAFPQQFDSLRQGMIDLIANVFDQSVYQDAPILRGIYFTSGTQEGRPIDRVMAGMAEAFGVRPRMAAAPPAKPKSYFVRDLFQRIVFPDRDVAVQSAHVLRRQQVVRWAVAAGALAASAAFLVLPISSYLENQRFVADARLFVERLARARQEREGTAALAAAPLESADAMAARLAGFASKGPDVSLRFGLYPGERLMIPLESAVERLVLRPVLDSDAERLMEFARGRGSIDGADATSGLMLQLLCTQPKASDEPGPEGDGWHDKWVPIVARLSGERWAAGAGEAAATARARHAVESAATFWALGAETAGDLLERKASVVSRVRATLLGATEGDPLADLLRDPNLPRDVRLIDMIGGAVTVFQDAGEKRRTGAVVSGAFTPAGWKVVKARIERMAADREHDENAWVLGATRKREAVDVNALQAGYFRRYIDAWRSFLLSLALKEPHNVDEVRSLLKTLMQEKPLEAIWRNVGKELQFKDESLLQAAAGKARGGIGKRIADIRRRIGGDEDDDAAAGKPRPAHEEPTTPEDVGTEFAAFLNFGLTKPTGLDSYAQILAELSGAVGEQGTPEPRPFQSALRSLRVKLANLINPYNENAWEGPLLDRILTPPLSGAEVAVTGATGDSANRKWCDSIVVVWDQLLAGKYPFTRSTHEAHVADVDKFFQPKTGTLWQYYAETLQSDIEHPAGTTVFHLKDQPSVRWKPNLLAFLKHAQELTDFLYTKEPGKPGVAAQIRIRASAPYSRIVFESGGRKVTYINTKERWDDLVWPARGALFRFYQRSGDQELGYSDGEWALFHLLEDGRLTTVTEGEGYLSGTWTPPLGDGIIHADFRPVGLIRVFRGFDMPRSVVAGAGGCGK